MADSALESLLTFDVRRGQRFTSFYVTTESNPLEIEHTLPLFSAQGAITKEGMRRLKVELQVESAEALSQDKLVHLVEHFGGSQYLKIKHNEMKRIVSEKRRKWQRNAEAITDFQYHNFEMYASNHFTPSVMLEFKGPDDYCEMVDKILQTLGIKYDVGAKSSDFQRQENSLNIHPRSISNVYNTLVQLGGLLDFENGSEGLDPGKKFRWLRFSESGSFLSIELGRYSGTIPAADIKLIEDTLDLVCGYKVKGQYYFGLSQSDGLFGKQHKKTA